MLTAAIVAALIQSTPPGTPDMSWLAGYWLDCSNGREQSETWSDPRAGLSIGHAMSLSGTRVSFEFAQIGWTAQGFAYSAQPRGVPPTVFVLSEGGLNRAVFDNPENDFPTRIVYERDGDALMARIEGEMNGQARSMEWNFTAAPLNARCPA